jgi:hypothetical protein
MGEINLPPGLFYGVGAVLVVFGALRAYFLGWKQKPPRPVPGDPEKNDDEPAPSGWSRGEGGGHKRHLTFGLLWFVMGIFLVISTILNSR